VQESARLVDLFRKYGTDKVDYAEAYEVFLRPRRRQVTKLLEVGIGTLIPEAHSNMVNWAAPHYRPGGSLRSWRDYFPNATIIGVDVQPDTQFSEDRIKTFLCNSTNRNGIQRLIEAINFSDIDIIIDDGSHRVADQVATIKNLFPFLSNDGLYVIEDIVGNGLFEIRNELQKIVGNSALFWVGMEFNPLFIQKFEISNC
jgi:hypothetical protein